VLSPYDWTDVAQFDYANKDLRKYMIDAMKFWVQNADIDGFRCDVAGLVPVDFWDEARAELDKLKPVFMLAEAEEFKLHKKAFDMTYGWNFHHIMNKIARGESSAAAIDSYYVKEQKDYSPNDYRMFFTSNHDENSWNGTEYERMKDGAKTFAALTYAMPAMPLIYSGQEAALNRRLKFFEKDPIDWKNYELAGFYKTLNMLKKNNKALWNGLNGGELIRVNTSDDKAIYSFIRKKDNSLVFCVFNLTAKPQDVQLKGDAFAGDYTDAFIGKKETVANDAKFKLAAWEYKILVK